MLVVRCVKGPVRVHTESGRPTCHTFYTYLGKDRRIRTMKNYNEHRITQRELEEYLMFLRLEEHADSTVEKYRRNLAAFFRWLPRGEPVTKELVHQWKEHLIEAGYAVSTVNGILAAVNGFLSYIGCHKCRVKALRRQRRIFADQGRELSRDEYARLIAAARSHGNERLMMVMETICATGIRVSELRHITVQTVRQGQAQVQCKGKHRVIFLPQKLQKLLLRYAKGRGLDRGPVFVTGSGRPLERTNIWREMKRLCRLAQVSPEKVFPHNLRHLFARTFYALEKDIAKLADLLGHASIETTRIYIMESGVAHRRCMERMRLIL